MSSPNPSPTPDLERLARRRAGMKLGWISHATVYVIVNAALMIGAAYSGRNWAIYPLLGWGLGLAIHGAAVLLALSHGGSLYQRLLQRERESLQRDPW